MIGKYFWVIFVLLGLWQWIGTLAERATKKQQEQRVLDLAARRKQQQMGSPPTAAGGTAQRAFGPGGTAQRAFGPGGTAQRAFGPGGTAQRAFGPGVTDRAGDLATRRKAQLDELRRRSGTATGQPPARTRPTPVILRPTLAPATRPAAPPPPATLPQRPTAPVRRQPAARPQAHRAPPPPQKQKRPVRPVERSTETPQRVRRHVETVEVKGPRELALPGLDGVPMDRTLLRRMMLYREILEPPIALREVQTWER